MRPMMIKSVITADECDELHKHMGDLIDQGKCGWDHLVPDAASVYKADVFQGLLEKLRPMAEEKTGKSLLPTYTYARAYFHENELMPHLDREACEYSLTLQVSHIGGPWPIWTSLEKDWHQAMAKGDAVEHVMDNGDVVLYKGCEHLHWRYPFEGDQQVQIFVHYVDANGPYKDHANDAFAG